MVVEEREKVIDLSIKRRLASIYYLQEKGVRRRRRKKIRKGGRNTRRSREDIDKIDYDIMGIVFFCFKKIERRKTKK